MFVGFGVISAVWYMIGESVVPGLTLLQGDVLTTVPQVGDIIIQDHLNHMNSWRNPKRKALT